MTSVPDAPPFREGPSPPHRVDRGNRSALRSRLQALIASGTSSGNRRMLGITGAPGSGKSTLAEEVVAEFAPAAVLVPMDGFHLADAELERLGIHDRKGAVDTFDAGGFVSLLRRLRQSGGDAVYAPTFRRDLEEAIVGAIRVDPDVPLVVTEGNYLLVDDGPWAEVRSLLDEVWYLEPAEDVRIDRLVHRHMSFGRDLPTATSRALGSDQRNADVILATRSRADVVVVG
jgi:pantothenate kinase